MLFLFAGIFGFARGGTQTLPSPLVATFFGLKSHGLIFGTVALAFAIGATIGPLLAGYIFDATHSYHAAFILCALASIAGLILAVILRLTRTQ